MLQSLGNTETKRDPYQDWTFSDFFQEDTLVLTSSYTLPTTCRFLMACLPDARLDALPLQHSRMAGRPAVDMEGTGCSRLSSEC